MEATTEETMFLDSSSPTKPSATDKAQAKLARWAVPNLDQPEILRVDIAARPFAAVLLFLAALVLWASGISEIPVVPVGIIAGLEVILILPSYLLRNTIPASFRRYQELLLDVLLITLIIFFIGGSDASFLTLAYVLVIMYAGFVISPNTAITLATVSGVSYATLLILEYTHVIPHYSLFKVNLPPQFLLASIVFNLLVFSWTAVLVVSISRRIRQIHADAVQAKNRLEQALQALESTQEQLLQSAKLAAIGQLVSGVAHEMNNPLAGIIGYSELLLGRDINEHNRSALKKIYGEAQRTARIVRNLLSFARAQKSEKKPVSINDLLISTLELRNYELKVNNITVHSDLDRRLPATVADPQQLQQVFLNLINNTEQALLSAGDSGNLLVKTRADSGNIYIIFCNDGPNIPEEYVDKIFDPFFTTKEVGKGTGLGLSICYGIIQEHGGDISAHSPPEGYPRGACFTVKLPISLGSTARSDPAES
jgi:signal transduction histidine kinase